jgi:hypothetical protein
VRVGTTPLWLIIPLLLSIDIWYAISIRRTQKPPVYWQTAIVLAAVFGVVGLPIISQIFPFLPLDAGSIPGMIIASLITGVLGVWLGQFISDMSGYGLPESENAPAPAATRSMSAQLSNALLYVAFAAFVLFFVVTATPPV